MALYICAFLVLLGNPRPLRSMHHYFDFRCRGGDDDVFEFRRKGLIEGAGGKVKGEIQSSSVEAMIAEPCGSWKG